MVSMLTVCQKLTKGTEAEAKRLVFKAIVVYFVQDIAQEVYNFTDQIVDVVEEHVDKHVGSTRMHM